MKKYRRFNAVAIVVILCLYSSVAIAVEPDPNFSPYDFFYGYQEETQGYDNDPISTARGHLFYEHTDLSIESRLFRIDFSRFYNSHDSRIGPFGTGWSHTYNIFLTFYPFVMGGPFMGGPAIEGHWADGRSVYWIDEMWMDDWQPIYKGFYDEISEMADNTFEVRKRNIDTYRFDQNGRLLNIIDKNGNTITLAYDDLAYPDLVTSLTDPVGRAITFSYDGNGFLQSVTDFAIPPRSVQYSYTNDRLTQVTDVLGNTINYTYNAEGQLETITDQRSIATVTNIYGGSKVIEQYDGNNNRTQYTYTLVDQQFTTTITHPNGNTSVHRHSKDEGYWLLTSIENPFGDTITYTYDDNNNRTSITDRNGNVTSFAYDSRGNVISENDPNDLADPYDGGISTVEYNDIRFPDLPTKKTDALGRITLWEYDPNGNVERQVNPDGTDITWTYNSFGQKLTETDENSNTTNYTYDPNGLLTQITDPNGNHTWYGYDDLWRLIKVTDGRGSGSGDASHTTTTVYDDADRVVSVTGPITSQSNEYDEIGTRTKVVNGRGYTIRYEYDGNSNLSKVVREIPSDPNQITSYTYDSMNHKITMTDPNYFVTQYSYDDLGRLITQTDPENNTTTYTYDPHGNMLSVTDANDVTVYYEYDSLNRKTRQYDELGNSWYWQYDKLDNLTKHTDAKGNITQYSYDTLNRLISVTDAASNTTAYEYDNVGNLTQIKDGGNRIIAKKYYDAANRLITQEDGDGRTYVYGYDDASNLISVQNANSLTKTMVYDNENRLTEIHYPDATSVIYTYDDNGNVLTMTDHTGTITYTYDPLDRLTSSTDSFGKQVDYEYDSVGNIIGITYPTDSTNPQRTVTYTYDKANRLDKITDWDDRVWDYTTDGAGRITQMTYPSDVYELRAYDAAGRLSQLAYKQSDDTTLFSYTYTRDAQGNPTAINETGTLQPDFSVLFGKTAYTHNDDNRLTSSTVPATYSYDGNGNLTSLVTGGVTTNYTYDFENRLISQSTGGSTVQHTYDGKSNRIARNDNGTTTRYIVDRGRGMSHVLCETNASGEIIAYYIHGPTIVGRIAADGTARYYHTNAIGSVIALTDDTESVTDQYAYTSFGEPSGKTGSTANPFTYIGGLGVMAEDDGLYFMRARIYDSDAGRFLGKDPLEGSLSNPSTLVKYPYASNNPLMYIDPDGEEPLTIAAIGYAANIVATILSGTEILLDVFYYGNTEEAAEGIAIMRATWELGYIPYASAAFYIGKKLVENAEVEVEEDLIYPYETRGTMMSIGEEIYVISTLEVNVRIKSGY